MATSATNTTANLGLSQWVASDFVLREDFNSDNAAIDAGYAELEESISGLSGVVDTKASTASLTAHENSDTAHSALFAEKASVSALNAETTARQNADCFVKLFDVTATATVSQIDLDFSGIDKSAYSGFKIIVGLPHDNIGYAMRINNNSASDYVGDGLYVGQGGTLTALAKGSHDYLIIRYGSGNDAYSYPNTGEISVYVHNNRISAISQCTGYGFTCIYSGVAASAYTPALMSSINFVGTFYSGSTVKVYGIKI